ncbi:unnamed protein product [Spodoptera exigua]|uniref:DUF4789 domain-containing protein n=1 Tax=Spodoptera exigua TaxID=7107 RepID=A0A835L2E3_SPOEX|nr:hypothetical protein HW555_007726 [Spodoptera exigua]CAH0690074.1 unnamed protein product [Spodoptera exigua]
MCSLNSIIVAIILISMAMAKQLRTQDAIGFPEVEEDQNSVNKDNRQPVYIPSMCPDSELYYPGDQKDDWICDCRPAFLYHPKSDTCWPAYRKGPCQDGEYLVLKPESAIPVCEKNPCAVDTYVPYNGRCEQLATIAPCRHMWPIPAALSVNATNLAVTCERLNLESRFGEDASPMVLVPCPPGCKRSINGKCTPVVG